MLLAFSREKQVAVSESIPEGGEGVPNSVLYPFVLAGKLIYNFGSAEAKALAQLAAMRLESKLQGVVTMSEANLPLLGSCSAGYSWAQGQCKG